MEVDGWTLLLLSVWLLSVKTSFNSFVVVSGCLAVTAFTNSLIVLRNFSMKTIHNNQPISSVPIRDYRAYSSHTSSWSICHDSRLASFHKNNSDYMLNVVNYWNQETSYKSRSRRCVSPEQAPHSKVDSNRWKNTFMKKWSYKGN